jgi:hypothetical protein
MLGATKLRCAEMMFSKECDTNLPFVQNAITRDAFQQIRQFVHFADDNGQPKKGGVGCSPLQKVSPVMGVVVAALAAAWVLGKRICIDKSMTRCTGRAVSFIQRMPAKPTKCGIKAFALCCAHAGCLHHFEICTGKESVLDGCPGEVLWQTILLTRGLQPRDFYVVPGLMDVQAVESLDNTQVVELICHLFLSSLSHLVAFFWRTSRDGKIVCLSKNENKSVITTCLFDTHFLGLSLSFASVCPS